MWSAFKPRVLLTAFPDYHKIHGMMRLAQKLMGTTYSMNSAMWGQCYIVPDMLSSLNPLKAAHELEYCNKSSMSYNIDLQGSDVKSRTFSSNF